MSIITGVLAMVMVLTMASGYIIYFLILLGTLAAIPFVAFLAFAEFIREKGTELSPDGSLADVSRALAVCKVEIVSDIEGLDMLPEPDVMPDRELYRDVV